MRNNKISKYAAADVDRMERMRGMGMSCTAIAEIYDCTPQYISHLIKGETGPRYRASPQPERQDFRSSLTQADIRNLSQRGFKPNAIAAILHKPYREVRNALGLAQ